MIADSVAKFDPTSHQFAESEDSLGLFAREAIYYGAEALYLHQLVNFSRIRYMKDDEWLLQNMGISIDTMLDIASYIAEYINGKITVVGYLREQGHQFGRGELTNSLLIEKEDVRRKFGVNADAFFAKFVTPIAETNRAFADPFSINAVALAPIIEMDDNLYVPSQYRLFESIYESPFFWMIADDNYADTHAENRGKFLEKTSAAILREIFGDENVHENVHVMRRTGERGGEIDVLVAYGEFVIVVQAKSKRVTLKARAGDTHALKVDFKGAIQNPYRQALDCIDLIKAGARCTTTNGKDLELPILSRFFPMVILSDPFPASTMLSRAMLERSDKVAPVIWDIGVLDCVARLLPTPIEMLFYLKCRSDVFDSILSDSEYNYLGYHIRSKLALPPGSDIMMVERDFATVVDDFMISADAGIEADRPAGILERLEIPIVCDLLAELKQADPRVASVAIELYSFSSSALKKLSSTIQMVREEIAATGKEIKAFSIPTESGGLTYAVTLHRDEKAAVAARAIGAKHKYDSKKDGWYVVLDCIQTDNPIDALVVLAWPWIEDEREAQAARDVAKMFNSKKERRDGGEGTRGAGREF